MENEKVGIRDKEMAETLVRIGDYNGAREKLRKVQNLFPELENISQMITVCQVLCASKATVDGGPDWYWVLLSNAEADESHIRFKYQQLTSLFEPIKNKFYGTEKALSLIRDAFAVLMDKEKRSVFDFKRTMSHNCIANANLRETSTVKVMRMEKETTCQSYTTARCVESDTLNRNNGVMSSIGLGPKRPQSMSADPCIRKGGLRNSAVGIQPMVSTGRGKACLVSGSTKARWNEEADIRVDSGSFCRSSFRAVNRKGHNADYYDFEKNRKTELFAVGQIWAAYDQENVPRSYGRINKVDYPLLKLSVTWLNPAPVTSDEKRWCEVGLPVTCGYFDLARGTMVVSELKVFSHCISHFKGSTDEAIVIHPKKGDVWAIYKDWKPSEWCSDPKIRKGSGFLLVEILTNYSTDVGLVASPLERVTGFTSIFRRCVQRGSESSFKIPANHLFRFSHNVPAFRFTGREMEKICNGMLELDPLVVPDRLVDYIVKPSERSSSPCDRFTMHPSLYSRTVSDQETSLKDCKWSKKDFILGHIWAIYDDPDSMPRRYVSVKNVISDNNVCVTVLEPNPMVDDEIHWVEDSLPFTCGIYRDGKVTLNLKISSFSHPVTCEHSIKTMNSLYKIFPKKGEIWAIYKHWNAKWKQGNYNQSQFQIVEILTDFYEAAEIRIASLVEVPGYMTFFQRQLCNGFELIRTVSRMEVLSFSHQVPSYAVQGAHKHGIPEDTLHLDPDALPSNLAS